MVLPVMTRRKIRVLHIFRCLELGGLENRILRLAKGLDPAEFQIDFLTFKKSPFAALEPPPTTRHTLFEVAPGIHPRRLLELRRFIREGGYDIVHTHNWSVMFYGVLAARLAVTPLVFHGEHGMDTENLGNTSRKRVLAQRVLGRLTDLVVCVNEQIAEFNLARWGADPNKFKVIHNGVDLSRFSPTPREPGAPLTLGTAARFVAVKDIPCLIDSVRLLLDRQPSRELRLLLIGDGPQMGELRAQIERLGLADRVSFTGELRRPEDGYRQMDVFVNASRFEGMSNTLLEAMSCGIPVVASAVPGNQVWLTDREGARLFEVGSAEALAAALEPLLDDSGLREQMGRANRHRVEQDFDTARFLALYRETYLQQLRGKGL